MTTRTRTESVTRTGVEPATSAASAELRATQPVLVLVRYDARSRHHTTTSTKVGSTRWSL
eukprot:scaffold492110_cov38-Prasinocladus_malaysianus.AAC.1